MLEAKIEVANQALIDMAAREKQPFELQPSQEVIDYVQKYTPGLQNDMESPGFWNHLIGGNVGIARSAVSEGTFKGSFDDRLIDDIKAAQARVALLSDLWADGSRRQFDQELASCKAVSGIARAFDWTKRTALVPEFAAHVITLGKAYAEMAGERLIGEA